MRHISFDDEKINAKLARAYPGLSPRERAEILVELIVFVRALAGLVEREPPAPNVPEHASSDMAPNSLIIPHHYEATEGRPQDTRSKDPVPEPMAPRPPIA